MKKNIAIIKYLVPLIMVFFFIRNIVLVETENMDSWMGGGMRMFGRIDKMIYRVSGFNVEHNNKTYFVNLRNINEFENEDVEIRILPNEERLLDVLKEIKQYTWCYDKELDEISIKSTTNSCNEIIKSDKIKNLKVYKTQYDPADRKVKLKLLNDTKSK